MFLFRKNNKKERKKKNKEKNLSFDFGNCQYTILKPLQSILFIVHMLIILNDLTPVSQDCIDEYQNQSLQS